MGETAEVILLIFQDGQFCTKSSIIMNKYSCIYNSFTHANQQLNGFVHLSIAFLMTLNQSDLFLEFAEGDCFGTLDRQVENVMFTSSFCFFIYTIYRMIFCYRGFQDLSNCRLIITIHTMIDYCKFETIYGSRFPADLIHNLAG